MFRIKVTNLAILPYFYCYKLTFGHSGQSDGPNEFLMPKNQWIDTKFKYLASSEPKLLIGLFSNILTEMDIWPPRSTWKWSQWTSHAHKPGDRHQNQVFSLFRTIVTNLAILPYFDRHYDWPNWPKMTRNGHLAIQVNLRCLKMIPMNFPCTKTWVLTPKWSL